MMIHARFIGLLLLTAGVLGFSGPAGAAAPSCPTPVDPAGNGPVSMVADRLDYDWGEDLYRATGHVAVCRDDLSLTADQVYYDQNGDRYRADGAVVVEQGETRLSTDKLLWQAATRDVVAAGTVVLSNPDGNLHGTSAHANLGSQRGRVNNGRILLKANNFHLAGKEIERLGESSYQVTAGQFTTCDGETPDWHFAAGHVRVDFGRYAVARDVWFKIHDLPLFYLPYLVFPVHSERESGFLLPRFGQSERKGVILSLAWYQVIDRNLDATLYLDYLSELGVGKGLEYRYIVAGDNAGDALLYHVTGLQERDDTSALKWRHAGTLPGGVRLAADVEYVEDIEFFEDFGDTAEEYTRDFTVSTITLQRSWKHLNLTVLAEYVRDLEGDNDATLQRLPEVNLSLLRRRLGDSPLYLSWKNSFTNFTRKEGVDGLRFYTRPELSLPTNPGRWLELTPKVALHGRYYRVDDTDGQLSKGDYDDAELTPQYTVTASTRLSKVFPVAFGGFEKIKHSIEPEITYTYIPKSIAEQYTLPNFDLYDWIGPGILGSSIVQNSHLNSYLTNQIDYALVNRVIGRSVDANGNRSYRELLSLRLSQRYDLAVARDDTRKDPEPFSDLRAELQVNPTSQTSLAVDAYLPVYGDQRFSKVTASAGYSGRPGNSAALSYSYARDNDGFAPTDYLGFELATAWLAPVYAGFLQRYDLRESQSLESLLSFEYRSQCWSLFLTLRHRSSLDDRPDDNEIMIGFSLSGLGRIGGFGSKLR